MEEIIYTKGYEQLRDDIKEELAKSANSFVKIGYLLKVARDTNVLKDSPYSNMEEFAKQEFGIDKGTASKFMGINDRFSEGGYSEILKKEYTGIGWSKLSIMLQLPDAINEELSANFSKSELNELREEVAEAQKETPMEILLEGETETTAAAEDLLTKAILQLGENEPGMYAEIHKAITGTDYRYNLDEIKAIMAPSGEKIYSIRIRGVGRIMLSLKDYEETVALINERTGEKETKLWDDVARAWIQYIDIEQMPEKNWEAVYKMAFPVKKEEVAPVQLPKEEKKVKKVNEKPASTSKNGKKSDFDTPKKETTEEQKEENHNMTTQEPFMNEPDVEKEVETVEEDPEEVDKYDLIGQYNGCISHANYEMARENYSGAIEALREAVNYLKTLEGMK